MINRIINSYILQLNSNLNSFKIFASFFDAVKNRLPSISLNARNYLNYAFSYVFNFEIISRDKNLQSNYYGFLFNKQISLLKGGIEQWENIFTF